MNVLKWSDGYVTEIAYPKNFHQELSPARLCLTALIKGIKSPAIHKEFNYLELGCGRGISTNIFAASNPKGNFFATDFNPSHIAGAQQLAQEAELNNISFFEDSFADLKKRELPMFDFICLHGLYSWISRENQLHVLDIVRDRLKTGGIVYLSYNCLPGWSEMAPLRRLLYDTIYNDSGPILSRLKRAFAFIGKFKNANPLYFKDTPKSKILWDIMIKENPHYVAHEYLNADWTLFYHADVVKDMSTAKLSYVGSTQIIENFDKYLFSPAILSQINQVENLTYKETLKDYTLNQHFRRDVFVRGITRFSLDEQIDCYANTPFALFLPRHLCKLRVKLPIGEVVLNASFYNPILDAISEKPKTMTELLKDSRTASIPMENLVECLNVLTSTGYLSTGLPFRKRFSSSVSCQKFNQVLLNRMLRGKPINYLVSPFLGSAFPLDSIHQKLLLAHLENDPHPVEVTFKRMKKLGDRFIQDGQPIQDEQQTIQRLSKAWDHFSQETIPLLKYLEII